MAIIFVVGLAVIMAGGIIINRQLNAIDLISKRRAEARVGLIAWKAGSRGPIQE